MKEVVMSNNNLIAENESLQEELSALKEENLRLRASREAAVANFSKSETLLSEMGRLARVGAWEIDIKTEEVTWTDQIYAIHEIEKSYKPTLREGIDFYTPESRPIIEESLKRTLENGEVFDVELEIVSAKKNRRMVRSVGRADKEMGKVFGTFQDITEQKLILEAQLFLISSQYLEKRETFFESLARFLSEKLFMDFVCIDRLQGNLLVAKTLAIYYDGKFDDNVEYTLKDTPCGDVVGKTICFFPRGVRYLFPNDVVLQEMAAESYLGTTLWSSSGKPIGLIAVIGRKPIPHPYIAEKILNLVSVRAAGELERNEAEEALRQERKELVLSNSLKDKFFSIIAHDLRNPFHAFLNLTEIMAYEGDELTISEFRKLSKNLNDSAKNLYNLLNNLLEWSKIQQGIITFDPENINLQETIEQIIESFRESASQKQLNITHRIPIGSNIVGDRSMFSSIISNLVSNAIKFSHKGGDIKLLVSDVKGEFIEVSVVDSGIGIPESMIGRLFKIEQKVGRTGTDGERSSGLGLHLCKEFVERHGGKLWVESEEGEGSKFYFTVKSVGSSERIE
jgi:signal transduction histidine kinase